MQTFLKEEPNFRRRFSFQLLRNSFFKWADLDLFFIYFRSFNKTIQFLQQINVKNGPSSLQRRDSNPRPIKLELSPITNRPGLMPL